MGTGLSLVLEHITIHRRNRIMRASKMLAPTLREVPAEAEIASHQLMMRAAMLRKVASGVYTYMPLAWRTMKKSAPSSGKKWTLPMGRRSLCRRYNLLSYGKNPAAGALTERKCGVSKTGTNGTFAWAPPMRRSSPTIAETRYALINNCPNGSIRSR